MNTLDVATSEVISSASLGTGDLGTWGLVEVEILPAKTSKVMLYDSMWRMVAMVAAGCTFSSLGLGHQVHDVLSS